MRVVTRSVSDVVKTLLSHFANKLPERCYNVATILSPGFLVHFITDNSDFFSGIERVTKVLEYLILSLASEMLPS